MLYPTPMKNKRFLISKRLILGITNAGVWAASCSYIAQSFEPQFRISTQGVLQGVNHGFGKGLGAIFGGVITTYFGTIHFDIVEKLKNNKQRKQRTEIYQSGLAHD